jgi:hypothetical protein
LKTTTGFETNNEVEFELFLLGVFNSHMSIYLIIESLQRINTIHINAINSKARGVHTTRRTKGSRIGSIKFLTDCNFITSRTTLNIIHYTTKAKCQKHNNNIVLLKSNKQHCRQVQQLISTQNTTQWHCPFFFEHEIKPT